MGKRIYWVVGFFIFLLLATFIFYGVKVFLVRWYMAHFQEPPITISTTTARAQTWHPFIAAVGSLKASSGVEVNPQVSGQILSIHFHSGDHVKQGDLLVQLDDEVDRQALQRDQAGLRMNKLDYERKQELLIQKAVSKSAVDAAQAAYLQSLASVESDKVMLSKKQIRAPFSGKIGIRQVDVGQYVTSGTAIVTLQALNELFVDFSVPEQFLSKLHTGQPVEIKVDAFKGQVFQGKIEALNAVIDVGTRSLDVRAMIPNEKEILYPGLFADVKVILPEEEQVLTIPQTAINYSLYGDSVYVVQEKGKDKNGKPILIAVQKYIKVGERRGAVASITQGLKAGEIVVTSGQLKLQPNAHVLVNNSVTLTTEPRTQVTG